MIVLIVPVILVWCIRIEHLTEFFLSYKHINSPLLYDRRGVLVRQYWAGHVSVHVQYIHQL